MKREVVRMNEKTLIRIPKNVAKTLITDDRFLNHLYFSPVTNKGFFKLWSCMDSQTTDIKEISEYMDRLENSVWYYNHFKVKWWVETTAQSYDEFCEIARDYPISNEWYTTLVKRYCKWT